MDFTPRNLNGMFDHGPCSVLIHRLSSAVTPISNKKWIGWLLSFDYIMILAFYLLLAFTGIFAFEELNDLYTLNFQVRGGRRHINKGIHP